MMNTTLKLFGILVMAIGAVIVTGCEKKEPAAPTGTAVQEQAAEQAAAAAEDTPEQTLCPVMGSPINKDLFIEYEGKKVYFCCPSCVDEFKKNPEKYLSKLPQFQK